MTRTLNSNVDVIRIPSNNIETSYRNQDCCAFVKNYTGDKGYLIKSYFNVGATDYSKEQITEYLDLLIAFGIPYKYEFDNNKVTVEFSTDTLIHAQEGYVYFIFLRYLWSSLYKDLVRIAIDVTKTTKFDIFQAIQIAHHANNYSSGHSLYYQGTGCGYIYTFEEFKSNITKVRDGNLNLFFSRNYNVQLYNLSPMHVKYRALTSQKQSQLVQYTTKKYFQFNDVKALIVDKKYDEAYTTIMEYNAKYRTDSNSQISNVLITEISKYIDEELSIPAKVLYERCTNYIKTLDLTKMLGIKSNTIELDTKSSIGDLVVANENDNVILGIKHKNGIVKVINSDKRASLSSCGWFKSSEGRVLPLDTIYWKLKVELDENY